MEFEKVLLDDDDSHRFARHAVSKEPLRLFAGTRLIGFLEPDDFNWPRIFASFTATDAFDELRALFQRQTDVVGLRIVGEPRYRPSRRAVLQ